VDVQVSDGNQVDEESKKKAMLEEKVAQAKEKLRLIQQKKRQEDEEAERARELERRRMGQEVLQVNLIEYLVNWSNLINNLLIIILKKRLRKIRKMRK